MVELDKSKRELEIGWLRCEIFMYQHISNSQSDSPNFSFLYQPLNRASKECADWVIYGNLVPHVDEESIRDFITRRYEFEMRNGYINSHYWLAKIQEKTTELFALSDKIQQESHVVKQRTKIFREGKMTKLEREQRLAEALKFFTEAAEQCDADAQYRLGLLYYYGGEYYHGWYYGDIAKKDYTKAIYWYIKAAKQGHAGAQYYLGLMYDKGEGIEQNDAEAVRWWRKSAEQGHVMTKPWLNHWLNGTKWDLRPKDFVQLNAHGEQDNTSEQNAPTSPNHYKQGDIECIDAIRAALGKEGFEAYCIGNVIKYSWRYKHKNGLEDLKKARVYLNWTIEQKEK